MSEGVFRHLEYQGRVDMSTSRPWWTNFITLVDWDLPSDLVSVKGDDSSELSRGYSWAKECDLDGGDKV